MPLNQSGEWDLSQVYSGQYGLWGYEHFLYRKSLAGEQLQVAQELEQNIATTTSQLSGIPISYMQVRRDSDGGKIESGGSSPNTS